MSCPFSAERLIQHVQRNGAARSAQAATLVISAQLSSPAAEAARLFSGTWFPPRPHPSAPTAAGRPACRLWTGIRHQAALQEACSAARAALNLWFAKAHARAAEEAQRQADRGAPLDCRGLSSARLARHDTQEQRTGPLRPRHGG